MVEIKHKEFTDMVPIMFFQNSSQIIGLRIYSEGRTQILLSSPATIDILAQDQKKRVYADIKTASNTKIDHIMVSFTDHYNSISIDRLLSKTKLGKDQWYFTNFLLCKPEFSSLNYKEFAFFIKNKKTILQQVTGGNTPIPVLKRMLGYFLKFPPLKKILELQY